MKSSAMIGCIRRVPKSLLIIIMDQKQHHKSAHANRNKQIIFLLTCRKNHEWDENHFVYWIVWASFFLVCLLHPIYAGFDWMWQMLADCYPTTHIRCDIFDYMQHDKIFIMLALVAYVCESYNYKGIYCALLASINKVKSANF